MIRESTLLGEHKDYESMSMFREAPARNTQCLVLITIIITGFGYVLHPDENAKNKFKQDHKE